MGEQVSFCKGLDDLSEITAKSVAEAAIGGDEVALNVYSVCAEYLGKALALLIDILNPEMIILGSIYGRAKPLLEPVMIEVIHREAIAESRLACRIVSAGLSENIGDIAALSLALLISNED
jgi:glucokinase